MTITITLTAAALSAIIVGLGGIFIRWMQARHKLRKEEEKK